MPIEYQVCSFEQAQKLHKLGVFEESYFVYGRGNKMLIESWTVEGYEDTFYRAFTVPELTAMLPDYYVSWRFKVSEKSDERKWIATVICGPKPAGVDAINTASEFDRFGNTQAEALATLLISLLETGVITKEQISDNIKSHNDYATQQ